jgi:hypothetical protein
MARKRPENAERDRQRGEEFVQALRAYVDLEKRSGRAKRVTNAAIGKAANIEPSIVTRIMNGDRIAHVGQILAIATALEAPDLLPADMRLGPQTPDSKALNRMSAPATRMPPGLEGFLERHAKRTKVTKRERGTSRTPGSRPSRGSASTTSSGTASSPSGESISRSEIARAVQKARTLIDRAFCAPGDPPSKIARELGIQVKTISYLQPGIRGMPDPGLPIILVAPCAYVPRFEWTVAHELIERELKRIHEPEPHEQLVNIGAAELMAPARAFAFSAASCNWDLRVLRAWWRHCSWEALARRVAELAPGYAASSWTGSKAKFRRVHPELGALPPEANDLEAFVAAEAAFGRCNSAIDAGEYSVRAWWTGGQRAVTLCSVK